MKRLILLPLLLLAACTSDGPRFTAEMVETITIDGQMPDETVNFIKRNFTVTQSGTVNFEMTILEAVNSVTGEPFEFSALLVNFGAPILDVEGTEICQITGSNFMSQGDSFSLGLRPSIYCLVFLRPDEIVQPRSAIVTFSMTLTGAFS